MYKTCKNIGFFFLILLCSQVSGQVGFVENLGQWPAHVGFKTDLPGGALYLENNAFTYTFYDAELVNQMHHHAGPDVLPEFISRHAFQVEFEGATTDSVVGWREKQGLMNYFLGDNPEKWVSGAKNFEEVRFANVYDGVGLKIYLRGSSLKYDFTVQPNADPGSIALRFNHVDDLYLSDGDLHIETSVNHLIELAPYAYQFIDGKVLDVECAFVLEGNRLHFELGEYNPEYLLTIDPEITFATYVGATSDNFGATATNDSEGNLIGGATVFGNDYPTTWGADQVAMGGGIMDMAVSKFSDDGGSLLFSTFIGGDGNDVPHSLICDADDNMILLGTTGSLDFPTTPFAYQGSHGGGPITNYSLMGTHLNGCDMIVAKFDEDGSGLIASTYIGGNGTDGLNFGEKLNYNYGDLFRGEVIVDDLNSIVVASVTASDNFPMEGSSVQDSYNGGETDGVLFKLLPDLSDMFYSTYLGGSGADAAYSIQFNSSGSHVVGGGTKSSNFYSDSDGVDNSFNGDVDGFLSIISEDGADFEGSTFIGTSEYEQVYLVQLDQLDDIYVLGQSDGNIPIVGDVYNNANSGQFIQKYNPDLTNLEWSTTIGSGSGAIDISPTSFLVSDCDQIYFTGWGGATNAFNSPYAEFSSTNGMPITLDAYQTTTDGSDFYLAVLSQDAEDLNYATFFGGGLSNEHVDGGTSKFDKDGSVYQAVCAGCGGNSDFPTTPGAWSNDNPSSNCNLGVFKFDLAIIDADIAIDGPSEVCEGTPIDFINNSYGGTDYEWNFGDGGGSSEFEPTHIYEENGTFEVQFILTHDEDCIDPDTTSISITILPGVDPSADVPDFICPGGTAQLQGYGTDNLYWLDDPTLSDTSIPNPTATTEEENTYYLVDFNDCEADTIPVLVQFYPLDAEISPDQEICIGNSVELEISGGESYVWSPAETLDNPTSSNPTASPMETTDYTVLITTIEGCEFESVVTIYVVEDFPGGNVYPEVGTCIGEPIMIEAIEGFSWLWSPEESLSDPTVQNPIANPDVTTTYYVEVSNICGTGVDEITVLVISPEAFAGDDGTICLEQWHPVWASGGETYSWVPALYAEDPTAANTVVSPPESMVMTCYVTDQYGCTASADVHVNVLSLPYVNAGPDQYVNWLEETYVYGSADGVDYWWTSDLSMSCTDCLTPEVTPEEAGYYVLHTIDELGCENTDSVFVDVFFPIYIPNTFTPNGDGDNDVFLVQGENIRGFHLEIWNRWGELIFETDDPNEPWNGSKNGGEYYVQDGTYIYRVTYRIKAGSEELVGHVNLIR